MAAMSCSNASFHYVSYPTAVLAKSCKLLPTMLFCRTQHSWQQWMAAASITIGISIFNYSRLTASEHQDSWQGMALLALSLLMDGCLAFSQDQLKLPSQHYTPPTAMETMLYVNLYALLWLLPGTILCNDTTAWTTLFYHHHSLLLLLNLAAASGQVFIFLTLTWFSPATCTTLTTTRKFVTILLSVRLFRHAMTTLQWTSIALVFGGLYTNIMGTVQKNNKKNKKNKKV
jgi:UDP-galactose transporter B1